MAGLLTKIFRRFFPPLFTVIFRDGRAELANGKVTRKVLSEFSMLAEQAGLSSGEIHGIRDGENIRLEFSDTIPESMQQRFRNVWALHR